MAVTQLLSSKGNVKKLTNQDFPFSPSQPAIASYYATSTASQSIINLPFLVDQTNLDNFQLYVDGKLLRAGSGNDYVFTLLDAAGFSSQITLNQLLVVGLNIQAFKLGLKKESEFAIDNRFVNLYEAEQEGFQGFVKNSGLLTPTTGSPSSSQFYSSIIGRASIVDLSQDLQSRIGVERISTQQPYRIFNEYGPNNELAFGVVNDSSNRIRLVGFDWMEFASSSAQGNMITSNLINSFVEITFYGTGLNFLSLSNISSGSRDWRASVDGGSEGSSLLPSTSASSLQNRSYSANCVYPVVSGLSLGVHTIKIRNNSNNDFEFTGFEILNESSSVKTQPGTGYTQGKKLSLSTQSLISYNSVVTGTRGGRVLVYQSSTGAIAQTFQAVNGSQANLSSADHTNEEVARVYNPREFGCGRQDDFSRLLTDNDNRAFTLEDGTTALMAGPNTRMDPYFSGAPVGVYANNTNSFIVLTFVGTGLDVVMTSDSSVRTYSIQVDNNTSIGNISSPGTANMRPKQFKIVSGLTYGTHTVRFTSTSSAAPAIVEFIVYQPKKPILPSGTVELADYNVMANYDGSIITGTGLTDHCQIAAGVLSKHISRELVYRGGGWGSLALDTTNTLSGHYVANASTSQPHEYAFIGTGFIVQLQGSGGGTYDYTVTVDSVLNASGVARSNASNLGGGSYRCTTTTNGPSRVEFTGLSYGLHTVSITKSAGSGTLSVTGFHYIPLIHSHKSNLYGDLQSTLPVGSCSISDNRKLTPVKEVLPSQKGWAQAVGIVSGPTCGATVYLPLADMNLTLKTTGNPVEICFNADMRYNTSGNALTVGLFVNGILVLAELRRSSPASDNAEIQMTGIWLVPLSAGTHNIAMYWKVSAGLAEAGGTYRTLIAKET